MTGYRERRQREETREETSRGDKERRQVDETSRQHREKRQGEEAREERR